ncbi:hypothetical protein OHA77_27990 [Streptosporangium sp. NBC_01639]|uniref:hypothetical protein n=1 Tax=Streptosporangium sp. NBC_01639 TaxID=2975948 RepID=UPI00387062C7|nr:hypothetical protein OHA77_27990 [Streptosporangium sp. NBC_01639]
MNRWRSAAVTALASVVALSVGPAAHAEMTEDREFAAASKCASGPGYPDYSYTFGSPYSFTFGSTKVKHSQLRISDKNAATVTTKWKGMKIYLERTDGRICGPKTVVSQGDGTYFAGVQYLSNPGYGVRACVKYRTGDVKCGEWKKE